MAGAQFVKKKPDVVSALRPASFIQYLESCISRLNVIPCHDLTLSVGEPDNAAAKLRSEQTVTPLHEQSPATYFLRLNNLETFVELVGARPLHLLSQTVLPLKSPTGAFIAALRKRGLCVLSAAVEGDTNVRAKLPLRVSYFVLSGSHGKKQAALCCGDGTSRPCGGASSSPALPFSFDISFDRKQGDASILHSFVRVRPAASGSPQSLPSWKAPAPLPVPAPG